MDPATIGISIIAVIAGGTALGFYAMWRHSEELQRGFLEDARRYRFERDKAWDAHAKLAGDHADLLWEKTERRRMLSEAGKKGRQIQLEKRRAA